MTARRALQTLTILAAMAAAGPTSAAAPLRPGDAARLTEARAQLDAALAGLKAAEPDAVHAARQTAEAALARIEALTDSYHHAPNLSTGDMRVHALAMRAVVGRLFAPGGPLLLRDDVIHPRPAVAGALADAARRAGDADAWIRWLRAALATAPTDRALLTALRDACLSVGDLKGSNAAAARLAATAAGSGLSAP